MPSAGQSLLLNYVDWGTYGALFRAFAERPRIRLTYDRGDLEIQAPPLEIDHDGRFLGLMVHVLTEELDLPLKGGGSTTLCHHLKRCGIEADECFWIANAHRMAGIRRLNLNRDPPPDLAIELEVTTSALNRLSIYGRLGVPEVWWVRDNELTFHQLQEDTVYCSAEQSKWFPLVTPMDMLQFLNRARRSGDQNPVVRAFRKWVRKKK